jgi:hypothetical protein
METTERANWLRRLWRNTVPLDVRRPVGTFIGLVVNFKSTQERLARDQAFIKSESERLARDQALIQSASERLARDQALIQSASERLARDQAVAEELNSYLRRERDWLAQGGSFESPEKLPPGMFSDIDMAAIADLAKRIPAGGTIVDIGSLAGRSTALWCIYSQAGRIVCIDPWEDRPWTEPLCPDGRSIKDNFLHNVTDKRVEIIQGYSPACAKHWKDPIDLYWEDGDHSDPVCTESIRFWSEFVRPGGIACGHDYHLVDVKSAADALAARWGSELHLCGSVWWVRRPGPWRS